MKKTLEKYVIDYQGCKSNPGKTLCMLHKKTSHDGSHIPNSGLLQLQYVLYMP